MATATRSKDTVWFLGTRKIEAFRDIKFLNESPNNEAVIKFTSTEENHHDQEDQEQYEDVTDIREPEDSSDEDKTLRENGSDDEESNESLVTDDEDECRAPKCIKPKTHIINWVQFDQCQSWYHTQCVGIQLKDVENQEYICGRCANTDARILVCEEPTNFTQAQKSEDHQS